MRWKHSVELEDWIEEYRVVDSTVEISATRFKTFGAGVPAHAGHHTKLDHGWVVMSGIDRDVAPLTVQAASAESYRFRYDGGDWQRLSHGDEAPILVFHVVDAPLASVAAELIATVWHGVRS